MQKERSKVHRFKKAVKEPCEKGAFADTPKAKDTIDDTVADLQLKTVEELEEKRYVRQKALFKKLITHAERRHERVKKLEDGTKDLAHDVNEFAGNAYRNGTKQTGPPMGEALIWEEFQEIADEQPKSAFDIRHMPAPHKEEELMQVLRERDIASTSRDPEPTHTGTASTTWPDNKPPLLAGALTTSRRSQIQVDIPKTRRIR